MRSGGEEDARIPSQESIHSTTHNAPRGCISRLLEIEDRDRGRGFVRRGAGRWSISTLLFVGCWGSLPLSVCLCEDSPGRRSLYSFVVRKAWSESFSQTRNRWEARRRNENLFPRNVVLFVPAIVVKNEKCSCALLRCTSSLIMHALT